MIVVNRELAEQARELLDLALSYMGAGMGTLRAAGLAGDASVVTEWKRAYDNLEALTAERFICDCEHPLLDHGDQCAAVVKAVDPFSYEEEVLCGCCEFRIVEPPKIEEVQRAA